MFFLLNDSWKMLFTNVDNEGHSDLVFEMIKKTLFHM
jgi:hypothetical protein